MKINRIENDRIVEYEFSCIEDLLLKLDEWRNEFRKINRTDEVIKRLGEDRAYDIYCYELNLFILQFTLKDKDNNYSIKEFCSTCKKQDHEGVFCRCEMRNIDLAKQNRKQGKSPWKSTEKTQES